MAQTSTEHTESIHHVNMENREEKKHKLKRRVNTTRFWLLLTIISFFAGLWGGYFLGFNERREITIQNSTDISTIIEDIYPPEGFPLRVQYGEFGPLLIAAQAFKLDDFVNLYQKAEQPLNEAQMKILTDGSASEVVFNQQNTYFLLNLFWALGLTNQNPVLDEGPIMNRGRENIMNYASTGGWTLAARPVNELFSSTPIVKLTSEQQERLEEVTITVFRPCCDNPAHFPDCNHGMAMLGLLELMASQGASKDEMFQAAKYANAYWYPSQTVELAVYFNAKYKMDFSKVDSRQLVSQRYSSHSSFQNVHQWLSNNNLLPQSPGSGNSCGV